MSGSRATAAPRHSGVLVLSESDLSDILTRAEDAPLDGPLEVWALPAWKEVVERGSPQCAAAKLCVLAAHHVLGPRGDDGSVVEYHDRLQLREGGCVVDVRGLATAEHVQCSDIEGLMQPIDAISCAVCIAVNWSRSCGLLGHGDGARQDSEIDFPLACVR